MQELAKIATVRRIAGTRPTGLSRRTKREILSFHLFTLPWLLGFIFLSVIPLLLGLATSFTDYDGLNLPYLRFMGLQNYQRAFNSPDFWVSLGNSAKYAVISVPVGLTLSLLLAVMLNQPIAGRDLFRVLYYIPSILPIAGAARAWS
ncbi:MAG TPA: sugar ABC transporter permease, partial [Candidatus Hydrogenedentes bacterium]|nr:sugar ABC transporter permease [Candidatus Hydrogenedentota bacterium]